MPVQKLPEGTRGASAPPRLFAKLIMPLMTRMHRRIARHPAWYHNIVAHPDDVWVEVSGVKNRVQVEQLEGESRDRAWELVTGQAPRFRSYQAKTDRQLPVLRLTSLP